MENNKTYKKIFGDYVKQTNEFLTIFDEKVSEDITKLGKEYLEKVIDHLDKHGIKVEIKKEK